MDSVAPAHLPSPFSDSSRTAHDPDVKPIMYAHGKTAEEAADDDSMGLGDKISAYYSLAFPNFTYYLQTLTVTIGRRSVPSSSSSTSASTSDGTTSQPQVDVDLGPLKSVSRLHARIEYEEENERFVLVVLGRNGAWVDGIWSGSGSRVPLGARSQIQIATRVFHFVLPPPPIPEASPPPSSPESTQRHLSPSIDITSLSPESSIPSPPPSISDLRPPPAAETSTAQHTPNASSKPAQPKSGARKRKKPEADVPLQLPEVMPPRPQFTYAQLCYKAIKAMEGKATLQEVCQWVSDNYDWYKYNKGTGWENSIRHNLSSNRGFKKMERCAGERGKGFFWSVDPEFEHTLQDPDSRTSTGGKDGSGKLKGKNGKNAVPLEPPFKRSIKGDSKSPLPPPLTSTPLPAFSSTILANANKPGPPSMVFAAQTQAYMPQVAHNPVKVEETTSQLHSTVTSSTVTPQSSTPQLPQQPLFPQADSKTDAEPKSDTNLPSLPADMIVPIVIGPMPPSTSSPSDAPDKDGKKDKALRNLSSPPIALQGNTLILNPTVFSGLTPEQLKELEALGARKAIEILQGYIVRFLKEQIKTGSSKGKSKSKKKAKAKAGEGSATPDAEGGAKPKPKKDFSQGPFTTAPLPSRMPQPALVQQQQTPVAPIATYASVVANGIKPHPAQAAPPDPVHMKPPVPVRLPEAAHQGPAMLDTMEAMDTDEIIDIDSFDGPLPKKRRLGSVDPVA